MFLPVQMQDVFLSGGGSTAGATTLTIKSLKKPTTDTLITMADFGTIGYCTAEPGTSKEENFSFTGVTQNANGTATLTGVTSGIDFVSPYSSTVALRYGHAGNSLIRFSNSAVFYSQFVTDGGNEVISGVFTFTNPNYPRMDTATPPPTLDTELATKKYVDDIAIAGAPDATTTVKGIVEIATQAEVNAGTAIGGTGASLVVRPSELAVIVQNSTTSYGVDSVGTDAYAITLVPAITAYVDGQQFSFKAGAANTGTATLNVGALGAITIKKNHDQNLETGDIELGSQVIVIYDSVGPVFQLQTQQASMPATSTLTGLATEYTSGSLVAKQEFTYNETITAGNTLKLINDGGTYKVENLIGIYNQLNASNALASKDEQKIIKLSDYTLVKVITGSTTFSAQAQIITINPTTGAITNGVVKNLLGSGGLTGYIVGIDVVRVDDTKFIVTYTGSVVADDVLGNVCTVSGTTITDASQFTVNSSDTTNSYTNIVDIGGGYFAICYVAGSLNRVRLSVWSLTGSTMALIVNSQSSGQVDGRLSMIATDLTNRRWTMIYSSGIGTTRTSLESCGFVLPATINSGAEVVLKAGYSALYVSIDRISDTRVACSSGDSATTVGVRTADISTVTTTVNASSYVFTAGNSSSNILNNDTFLYVFTPFVGGGSVQVNTFNLNGTVINYNNLYTYQGSVGGGAVTFDQNFMSCFYATNRIAVLSKRSDTSSWITTGDFAFDRFIGIANQSGLATEVKSVNTFGNIDGNQTGLLPVLTTYIGATGQILQNNTQTFISGSFATFPIGRAMSETEVLITDLI